jgi:hypothetical protein
MLVSVRSKPGVTIGYPIFEIRFCLEIELVLKDQEVTAQVDRLKAEG